MSCMYVLTLLDERGLTNLFGFIIKTDDNLSRRSLWFEDGGRGKGKELNEFR